MLKENLDLKYSLCIYVPINKAMKNHQLDYKVPKNSLSPAIHIPTAKTEIMKPTIIYFNSTNKTCPNFNRITWVQNTVPKEGAVTKHLRKSFTCQRYVDKVIIFFNYKKL